MAWLHSDEFRRDAVRIVLTSDLTRRQVASDLGIRLSTLDTWVRAISDEVKVPERDADLLRENEQLRKENRVLKEEREVLKTVPGGSPPVRGINSLCHAPPEGQLPMACTRRSTTVGR